MRKNLASNGKKRAEAYVKEKVGAAFIHMRRGRAQASGDRKAEDRFPFYIVNTNPIKRMARELKKGLYLFFLTNSIVHTEEQREQVDQISAITQLSIIIRHRTKVPDRLGRMRATKRKVPKIRFMDFNPRNRGN